VSPCPKPQRLIDSPNSNPAPINKFPPARLRSEILIHFNRTPRRTRSTYHSSYQTSKSKIKQTPPLKQHDALSFCLRIFRRCFFKHKIDDAEKLGTVLQDRDENTKLELKTGTAAELKCGNDIDTQLQSHAAQRLSWIVKCEDCTGHRTSAIKRDAHQDQATSEVIVWEPRGGGEILIPAPAPAYRHNLYDIVVLSLLGMPHPLASVFGI
jgi:hypothetical protein